MYFKHNVFKRKTKKHAFVDIFFAPLVVAGILIRSRMGTSLHQTCLDTWHFILALVHAFHGVTYFHHANISYSIKLPNWTRSGAHWWMSLTLGMWGEKEMWRNHPKHRKFSGLSQGGFYFLWNHPVFSWQPDWDQSFSLSFQDIYGWFSSLISRMSSL